ncbi:uncharacterized protein LOC120288254 [Eucalyptus grandis]|uniref:uncharacterized protein LOC120288254 n=1 Tax=Eucalyptus grandis TaxID=71139 RepID=UPI00192ED6D4|nr:uncharacterized protein LOC120288254 [Eucalyptus grandis]
MVAKAFGQFEPQESFRKVRYCQVSTRPSKNGKILSTPFPRRISTEPSRHQQPLLPRRFGRPPSPPYINYALDSHSRSNPLPIQTFSQTPPRPGTESLERSPWRPSRRRSRAASAGDFLGVDALLVGVVEAVQLRELRRSKDLRGGPTRRGRVPGVLRLPGDRRVGAELRDPDGAGRAWMRASVLAVELRRRGDGQGGRRIPPSLPGISPATGFPKSESRIANSSESNRDASTIKVFLQKNLFSFFWLNLPVTKSRTVLSDCA